MKRAYICNHCGYPTIVEKSLSGEDTQELIVIQCASCEDIFACQADDYEYFNEDILKDSLEGQIIDYQETIINGRTRVIH